MSSPAGDMSTNIGTASDGSIKAPVFKTGDTRTLPLRNPD